MSTVAANQREILGLQYQLETPENIVLNYQLAGPANRFFAFLIDTLIKSLLVICASLALAIFSMQMPGMSSGLFLVFWFVLDWGYFSLSEGFFNGQTIGKYSLGLRVIQSHGAPVTFWSAILRNLVRAVDWLPLYGIGFVCMSLTSRFQRLGDLAADTVVISERRVRLPREPIILERIDPLSRDEINTYVPEPQTLALIDEFLGRRTVLSHQRGHDLARILAPELAERLNYDDRDGQVESFPMAFLARVYVTFVNRKDD